MQKCPSFIILRNGIFYFQARIPAHLRPCFPAHKHYLVRRSTGTGNHREAISIARKWFVELTTLKSDDLLSEDERIEREYEREQWLYVTGKGIFDKRVAGLHPLDWRARARAIHDLMDDEKEALLFYEEYREGLYAGMADMPAKAGISEVIPSSEPPVTSAGKPISSLVNVYIEQSGGTWTLKTRVKFRQQILLFCEMVGDPPPDQLSRVVVREQFSHRIKAWPKHVSTKEKYFLKFSEGKRRTVEEVLAIGARDNDPPMGPRTVADYCKNVLTFLNWLRDEGYLDAEFTTLFKRARKDAARQPKRDPEFSPKDLKRLFENEDYRLGSLMKKPHWHWSPLIALFTGARETEICQLHLEDIKFDEKLNCWIIDFNGKDGKQLKTVYSARAVPVHPELINLGFIDYYNLMRKRGERQLFPDLQPDKYGHWGRSVSRWFNGYETASGRIIGFKEKCGVECGEETNKNFHSFRHTLINYGKQTGFDYRVMRKITGHATEKKDVHSEVYEKPFEMAVRKDTIDKVRFDVDFSQIRRWT